MMLTIYNSHLLVSGYSSNSFLDTLVPSENERTEISTKVDRKDRNSLIICENERTEISTRVDRKERKNQVSNNQYPKNWGFNKKLGERNALLEIFNVRWRSNLSSWLSSQHIWACKIPQGDACRLLVTLQGLPKPNFLNELDVSQAAAPHSMYLFVWVPRLGCDMVSNPTTKSQS